MTGDLALWECICSDVEKFIRTILISIAAWSSMIYMQYTRSNFIRQKMVCDNNSLCLSPFWVTHTKEKNGVFPPPPNTWFHTRRTSYQIYSSWFNPAINIDDCLVTTDVYKLLIKIQSCSSKLSAVFRPGHRVLQWTHTQKNGSDICCQNQSWNGWALRDVACFFGFVWTYQI